MRLRWTQEAIHDLTAIRDHIAQDRPEAARKVASRILEAVDHLEQFPESGRPGRVPGTRELVVTGTPYQVPYRIEGDFIELLRVLHGAQRWPDRF